MMGLRPPTNGFGIDLPERVLVLSYAFPPMVAPEAILSAKAARGLLDRGVEVDVVCLAARPWRQADPALITYVEGVAVRRLAEPLWLPLIQPVRALRRYPDAMRFVLRRAKRVVDTLDLARYDAMLSWSQWHSIHLLALEVKARRPDLRWVAHFSDPWVSNPLVALSGYARRMAERMERQVVEGADLLEFTTAETAELTVARYDEVGDVMVVPHGYDERLYPSGAGRPRGLVGRYLGSFYGQRTPEPLLEGLALLRGSGALDGVSIELIGQVPRPMLRTMAARSLPGGLVRARPPVSYVQSLAEMRAAAFLLLVDAPARHNVFLASKLIDYVGAGRPIVAITPPGRAAEIVRDLGGPVADPKDREAVAEALRVGIDLAKAHDGRFPWGAADVRAAFSLEAVGAPRFDALFPGRE
jgi:glycosyltransferase involved in cell wall biosynthesis